MLQMSSDKKKTSVLKSMRLAEQKLKEGFVEEAIMIYGDILEKFPKNKRALEGIKALNKGSISGTHKVQNPPQEQLQMILDLCSRGNWQQVLAETSRMIQRFPKSEILYNVLGAGRAALQEFDLAIKNYLTAIEINPQYAEAYNNLGIVLYEKGDFEAAIESYGQAIKIKPDFAEAHYNSGLALQGKGQPEKAIDSFKQALKINPHYAEAYYNIGLFLYHKGNLEMALDCYNKALQIKPDYAEVYYHMGVVLDEKDKLGRAFECYKKALQIKPDYAEVYNNLGVIHKKKGDQKRAIESYQMALRIEPFYPDAHRNISNMKKYTEQDHQFLQMLKMYDSQNISAEQRCKLCFALGKAYADLGDLVNSFNFLKRGNDLRKELLDYDISKDIKLFGDIKNSYPYIRRNSLGITKRFNDPQPIFILGMPRSGTTLVEQIVSSHSEVTGAGELGYIDNFGDTIVGTASQISSDKLLEFRKTYLSELQMRSDGSPFVTDKLPHNFLHIGLICLIFPEAKIIHVKRDPAATCWSNYQMFFPGNGNGYCYDLTDLVTYYGLYQDLMQFWEGHYDNRIHPITYEELTVNQEKETKELIQYLDLEWQDACLSPQDNNRNVNTASNMQVRKKVYQGSSEQWRKYEKFLGGKFDELQS
tara:strand:- start:58 stop:1995 length:1938 start_codon:yes stop_codon:yes gene_type:complete